MAKIEFDNNELIAINTVIQLTFKTGGIQAADAQLLLNVFNKVAPHIVIEKEKEGLTKAD